MDLFIEDAESSAKSKLDLEFFQTLLLFLLVRSLYMFLCLKSAINLLKADTGFFKRGVINSIFLYQTFF